MGAKTFDWATQNHAYGTVFWDAQGVLLVDFLPRGETINAAHYCGTLNELREAVHQKRPGRMQNGVIMPP
jgi:hypothetical protein